jgi:hypothetical protein
VQRVASMFVGAMWDVSLGAGLRGLSLFFVVGVVINYFICCIVMS